MDAQEQVNKAISALTSFEVSDDQRNERSAMTLLALLGLQSGDSWDKSTNPLLGTRAIMDRIRDEYKVEYKPNTRETIRRFTLHQFVIAGICEENADQPDRPINSPHWNYRITPDALHVFQTFGTPKFDTLVSAFLSTHPSYKSLTEERKNMPKTPVTLPNGQHLNLSPSGQSTLIKAIVEEMLPRFAPGSEIAFIDDTDHKHGVIDSTLLDRLGITIQARAKAPDVIAWDSNHQWLFLVEVASSHGPVDVTRKNELHELFAGQWDKVVLVSCFPTRKIMQKYLALIAWETEAWCEDTPDHMMHFNGSRFMGPYGNPTD